MLVAIIKLALIPISWLVIQVLLKLTRARKEATWVVLSTAALAVISAEVTDLVASWLVDPQLAVTVNHGGDNVFTLNVSKKDRYVDRLDITYQVLGRVTNIHNYDPNSAIGTTIKNVVGFQVLTSVNQLRITAQNIASRATNFSFVVNYEPTPIQKLRDEAGIDFTTIAGVDRFEYRYVWTHKGDTFERHIWRFVRSNKVAPPPPIQTLGFVYDPRVLSDEEMKAWQKKPVPLHRFP